MFHYFCSFFVFDKECGKNDRICIRVWKKEPEDRKMNMKTLKHLGLSQADYCRCV